MSQEDKYWEEAFVHAFEFLDNESWESKNNSTKYDVFHNNKRYPPKLVYKYAAKYIESNYPDIPIPNLAGGQPTNNFIKKHNFEVLSNIPDKVRIIYAYLKDSMSHRAIEIKVLKRNIDISEKGGGYEVMKILHGFEIHGDKKGILKQNTFSDEYSKSKGNYKKALELLQEYYSNFKSNDDNKFTWVKTHLEISNYLKNHKDNQLQLIEILKKAGVTGFSDKEENDLDIDLTVIDPFTFFCYIYKYGAERRLEVLRSIATQLKIHYPTDECGIPSSNAQKVWLFPYKKLRVNNEIERLWSFYFQVLNDEISNDSFEELLQIRGIARTKLTEALFNVNPEKYFPINAPTKPYLENIFGINPKFRTFEDYLDILKQIKSKTNKPFYQLSYEAWIWNEEQKKSNIMGSYNISEIKEEYIEYLGKNNYADSTIEVYSDNLEEYLIFYLNDKNFPSLTDECLIKLSKISRFEFKKRTSFIHEGKGYSNFISFFKEKLGLIKKSSPKPLNQILYGPPGTGKTYRTKEIALKIIDGIVPKSRTVLNNRYKDLVSQGQIVFTTFHQSMSYEDFVEGIKPKTENNKVIYEVEDGIFKLLSNKARGVEGEVRQNINNTDFKNCNYFKMSLGGKNRKDVHDWCIENNQIALGYGGNNNLDQINSKDWKTYKQEFQNLFPEEVEKSSYSLTATHAFKYWMKKGDIVLVSLGNNIIDAIGIIKGEYKYERFPSFPYHHIRDVEWIATNLNANPSLFVDKKISQQTIYQFNNDDIKIDDLESKFSKLDDEKTKEYVLIIDEINRGNVSGIFGELITLLEKDKRSGANEEIEVALPYSKELFKVPSNLHIIGTMNTADRSVEALDTALRRRFSFTEVTPNIEVLSKEEVEEIDIRKLLKTINDRIELLIDKDHKIGHSYFINIKNINDLKRTFEKNVIPLLEEYFFGNYGKIGLVLGSEFIELKEDKDKVEFANNFSEKYEDAQNLREKSIFLIKDSNNWSAESFISIYNNN